MSGVYGRANMGRKKFAVRDIVSKMSPADMRRHGSDYGSDVLTNLDFDIFESSASQAFSEKTDRTVPVASKTGNITTRREKILPKPQDQNIRIVPPLPKVQNILILPPTSSQY